MKHVFFITIITLVLIFLVISSAAAIGVQPMDVQIIAKPGETVPFKIEISSSEDYPETIKLAVTQPLQRIDGGLEFKPADPNTFPEAQWLSFSNQSITVPRGEKRYITGNVKIPLGQRGFHLVGITAEQPPAANIKALQLSVVYIVKLSIYIDAPVPKVDPKVSEFEIVKGSNGEPLIQFKVINPSELKYITNAFVALRIGKTKKLIERIQLSPKVFQRSKQDSVVLPRTTIQFIGIPKEVLLPGQYDAQLFFRFGKSGQIVVTKTFDVRAGDYKYPATKLRMIQMDLSDISITVKPGSMAMKGLKLQNRSDKPLKIKLEPMDINMGYPYSILKNTILQFKSGQEFTIEPNRMAVAILTIQVPRDALIQGNYGLIKLRAFAVDGKLEPIEETEIPIEVKVSGKFKLATETTSISAIRDGEKLLLSAVLKNNSNVKINPKTILYLKDKDGKNVSIVELSGENTDSFIPNKLMNFTGYSNDNIPSGNYKAEIKVLEENEEIGNSVLNLEVK